MSCWYKSKQCEVKVLRHLEGEVLILRLPGQEIRESVSKEVADIVDQMIEVAYLAGKEQVRSDIRYRLGIGE